jgi:small subunit ribosomal protein S17
MAKKLYTGKVVSDRMQKTVIVTVTSLYQHPVYKKTVKRVSRFTAHDPEGKCKIGDTVSIIESSPVSKNKRWKVLEIIEKE